MNRQVFSPDGVLLETETFVSPMGIVEGAVVSNQAHALIGSNFEAELGLGVPENPSGGRFFVARLAR